jgi:thiol-disulfide isomerase/thioredoxin
MRLSKLKLALAAWVLGAAHCALALAGAPKAPPLAKPRVEAPGFSYEPISESELTRRLQQHCTLVLPWASWCTLCLEEFPVLLPALKSRNDIKPLVLDLSRPFVQERFSRTFLEQLKLNFPTFRIPIGAEEKTYQKRIDPSWTGSLPTAFLVTCKGTNCGIAKRWNGKISVGTLDEVSRTCATNL